MKKSLLFLLFAFYVNTMFLSAIQSIKLQFQPDLPIDSIRVENLENQSSFTFSGGGDLQIIFGLPSSSQGLMIKNEKLQVFSFPNQDEVHISFNQLTAGTTSFEVYNLQGKLVGAYRGLLESSQHRFTFVPDARGVYLVRVTTPGSTQTAKFISYSTTVSATLQYNGFTNTEYRNQDNSDNESTSMRIPVAIAEKLIINKNDLLRIRCYAGGRVQTIYDYANDDKYYSLRFTDRYNHFQLYNIVASKPSFVDVMFAVTDSTHKGVDDLKNLDFIVRENGSNISASESFRHVQRMNQVLFKIVLLIDNSVSIVNDLEMVKQSAKQFVNKIRPNQQMAVYVFSDLPYLLQDFTADTTKLQQAINKISLGFPSTNLYGSMITALSRWTNEFSQSNFQQGAVVLFTDGDDTQGSSSLDQVISARGQKKVYVIGLGDDLTPSILNQISYPKPYIPIKKIADLENTFAEIQADIVRYSNSFYWLNYMTPKRTGTHALSVSTTGNTNPHNTSSITGNYSANGFVSVNSGVYINISDSRIYGIDSVFCFYDSGSYNFTLSRYGSIFSRDSLLLKPTTYWAFKQPEYNWSLGNAQLFKLDKGNYSTMVLKGIGGDTINTILSVQDLANNYTKNLDLQMHPEYPILKIETPSNITDSSVVLKGAVLNEGRLPVLSKGFVWDIFQNPTVTLTTKTNEGKGAGNINAAFSNLKTGTKYYIKVYASNSSTTNYSQEQTFTTIQGFPELTTKDVFNISINGAASGGIITHDGGAAITAKGVVWSIAQNPTVYDSYSSNGAGGGEFYSTITGLNAGTTYYVRAYATNNVGTAYGNEVSFYVLKEGEVYNPATGKVWMDRNLGASRVATFSTDDQAYGDLYQWGRDTDGHEKRTSQTTSTISSSDTPGHGKFITINTENFDWRSPQNNDLWQGVNGVNNPCPEGFRIPTTAEWIAEIDSWISNDASSPFASLLKLPMAGNRYYVYGNLSNVNNYGYYWSSTVDGSDAQCAYFGSIWASMISRSRATGASVRCIKEFPIQVFTERATHITPSSASSGGNITSDGGEPILERGVVWSTSPNPTVNLKTKTANGSGIGSFSSSITGLQLGITYYLRAYATNSTGTAYGNQVSFTTASDPITVNSITGKVWMDRNLGASRVATSSTDEQAYGDFYQWGRGADGHEKRNSETTSSLSSYNNPDHGMFITNSTSPFDWHYTQNQYLWQGVNGLNNNPCPEGFRIPTAAEWDTERASWSSNNPIGAFNSPLKLPVAGNRLWSGEIRNEGSSGFYWSSSVIETYSKALNFSNDDAYMMDYNFRAGGYSVRCLKDVPNSVVVPSITTKSVSIVSSTAVNSGGTITFDGGGAITTRGVVWSTAQEPTVSLNTKTTDGTGVGSFTSSITGLQPETTYYVRAYATNNVGTAYGNEVSFTISTSEGIVYNPATGKTWMDRNLGASRVATYSADDQAYGDLYQWGRGRDGHENRNSEITSTLSDSDTPGHGNFISVSSGNYDWRSPQNNNLWQGVDGVNNPCPEGFRIPTAAEWEAERVSWSSNTSVGAFASPLKLPVAGYRNSSGGSLDHVGSSGFFWSGTVDGTDAQYLFLYSGLAFMRSNGRALGNSVRCLKDD